MPGYIVYEIATGRIVRSGSADEGDVPLQTGGDPALVVEVTDFDGQIDDRAKMMDISVAPVVMIDRPVLAFDKLSIAADGVDQAVLPNLPNPTTVKIDGASHIVTDGTLEISSNMPATYLVEIRDPFPYQRFSAEIVAS